MTTPLTTKPMPYLDCLRWMLDHGYGMLMWPAIRTMGTVTPTKFEAISEVVEQLVAGDREGPDCACFVAEAEAMNGKRNAYLYRLPQNLDLADEAVVARASGSFAMGHSCGATRHPTRNGGSIAAPACLPRPGDRGQPDAMTAPAR